MMDSRNVKRPVSHCLASVALIEEKISPSITTQARNLTGYALAKHLQKSDTLEEFSFRSEPAWTIVDL